MKQTEWNLWLEENEQTIPSAVRSFLRDATLHEVAPSEVTFLIHNKAVTFTKLSPTSWTMPSTLFVPYGSLTGIFAGLNRLIEENQSA